MTIANIQGTVTIKNSTLQAKDSELFYVIDELNAPSITLKDTIVVGTSEKGSCPWQIKDGGNNLQFPGTDCGSSIPVGDPKLGPLQDNGGRTWTMAPQLGSAAVGKITDSSCPATDQRGADFMPGTPCDIGAFQTNGVLSANMPTATNVPTLTR